MVNQVFRAMESNLDRSYAAVRATLCSRKAELAKGPGFSRVQPCRPAAAGRQDPPARPGRRRAG